MRLKIILENYQGFLKPWMQKQYQLKSILNKIPRYFFLYRVSQNIIISKLISNVKLIALLIVMLNKKITK